MRLAHLQTGKPVFLVTFLSLLFVASACIATEPDQQAVRTKPGSLVAEKLIVSTHCNINNSGASANLVSDQQGLDKLYQQLNAHRIGGKLAGAPVVDFARHVVLIVSMGQRFTGGYSVKLADEFVQVKNDVAKINVKWRVPSPGGFSIQVLTSPCVVIKMPVGDYRQIDVVDQAEITRATLNR